MRIGLIALKLRLANTTFGNKIGGAAELSQAQKGPVREDIAFVIPLEEDAPKNAYDNGVNQLFVERFGIIVALPTDASQAKKMSLAAYDRLHSIRSEFFRALVNVKLPEATGPIYFRTGRLLDITVSTLWYQYEFEYSAQLVSGITIDLTGATIAASGDGIADIQSYPWDDRKQESQIADFNTIVSQWTLGPSVKLDDAIAEVSIKHGHKLPVSTSLVDMDTIVDLTDDPNAGAYNKGFGLGYDRINRNN